MTITDMKTADRRFPTNSPATPRPAREDQPPAVWPVWAIKLRQDYEAQLAEKDRRISELESAIMDTDRAQRIAKNTNALALYGDGPDVKALGARLAVLLPNAKDIGTVGVTLIAQVAMAHGLDPLPGADHIYAWKKDDVLTVTIGYKGLLHLARKQLQFTFQSHAMTPEERAEHGLLAADVGYITTLYELALAVQCKQAGIPYFPIVGSAKWKAGDDKGKSGDRVPVGKTPAWVAKKNSLKDALRQITSTGQRLSEALDTAFRQMGEQMSNVEYDGDGWTVPFPAERAVTEALQDGTIPPDDDPPEVVEGAAAPVQAPLFEAPSLCTHPGCDQPGDVTPLGFLCAKHAREAADAEAAAVS